ncbi:MAG: HAD family hydrolase, partial [Gemmataceae bacterium]|nr:HAD family hydrolase [Gemmataceae bacterium]
TGSGAYRAEKVGGSAFAQSVTADARRYRYAASPITRASNRIITALSGAAAFLCVVYAALYALGEINGERLFQMIAATVVSMVPQGLVLTATVAFTVGAVVVGRRGALVQRLNAVEAMAAVDVICTDKTGTLTTNKLTLAHLIVLADELGEGEVRRRLSLFASAAIDQDNRNVAAIRAAVGAAEVERVDGLAFNARTRFSAVRVRSLGAEHALVLGAPEALAPTPGAWGAELERLQSAGLRVLLFAETPAALEAGTIPASLRLVALVALADELRPDAAAVLTALAGQGIVFKAISGDNPLTVRATVAPLGLPLSREEVVSGKELAAAPDLVALVLARSVFGRVDPAQKVAIVEALQRGGRNVAMIGDGV